MRLKTQRRAIYAAMGLTVLALIGGFTLANLQLGPQSNASQQGSHTTTVSEVTGLTWDATNLTVLATDVTNTTGCASPTGCGVSTSGAIVCAGTTHAGAWCLQNDFVEQVTLNTTAGTPFTGTVELTVYVTAGGTTYTGEPFYFTDSSGNTRQLIAVDFDIGTAAAGPTVVSSVTVVANT